MQIKSVHYQDNKHNSYLVTYDTGLIQFVPDDLANMERRMISQWLMTDGNVVNDPTVAPAVIPSIISSRQFYQQLYLQLPDQMSFEQAYAGATSGVIPPLILTLLKQVPQELQIDAQFKIGSATTFERNNPLTELFGQLMGWTSDQIDQFFVAASKLV